MKKNVATLIREIAKHTPEVSNIFYIVYQYEVWFKLHTCILEQTFRSLNRVDYCKYNHVLRHENFVKLTS